MSKLSEKWVNAIRVAKIAKEAPERCFAFKDVKGDMDTFVEDILSHLGLKDGDIDFYEIEDEHSVGLLCILMKKDDKSLMAAIDDLGAIPAEQYMNEGLNEKKKELDEETYKKMVAQLFANIDAAMRDSGNKNLPADKKKVAEIEKKVCDAWHVSVEDFKAFGDAKFGADQVFADIEDKMEEGNKSVTELDKKARQEFNKHSGGFKQHVEAREKERAAQKKAPTMKPNSKTHNLVATTHDHKAEDCFTSQSEMEENITYTKTQADGDDTVYLNKGVEVARWHNNFDLGTLTESVIHTEKLFKLDETLNEEKLIKGKDLNDNQKKLVLAAYIYRNTKENTHPAKKRTGATAPEETDEQFLKTHAFYFVNDGSRLSGKKGYCEPVYEAKDYKTLSNVLTKKRLMSFEEFKKNKVGVEKGEEELVKASMAGEKTGDKGIKTMEDPKTEKGTASAVGGKAGYETKLDTPTKTKKLD